VNPTANVARRAQPAFQGGPQGADQRSGAVAQRRRHPNGAGAAAAAIAGVRADCPTKFRSAKQKGRRQLNAAWDRCSASATIRAAAATCSTPRSADCALQFELSTRRDGIGHQQPAEDSCGPVEAACPRNCRADRKYEPELDGGRIVTMQVSEKQRAIEALRALPEHATIDDAIERLCFIAKVEEGLRQSDARQLVSHDEVKKQFLS